MTDMLVKLYELPPLDSQIESMRGQGIVIRPGMAYEKSRIVAWVSRNFDERWASECDVAFGNRPISCFIATHEGQLKGFACYDSTCRDYFGPVGVDASARGRGIGTALLLNCLHAMAAQGYGYAIIGAVHDVEFYRKAVGAVAIEGSWPGVYRDRLK